jgi:hypothetical protein
MLETTEVRTVAQKIDIPSRLVVPARVPAAAPKVVPTRRARSRLGTGKARGAGRRPQLRRADSVEQKAAPMASAKTMTPNKLPISQAQAGVMRRTHRVPQ